ncbi:hypothetical protein DJ68_12945 [Halorubrum sp. C3]|nr:hypothetical protein DJ68_12945 [Halorubrum sp. C3]
MLYLLNDNDGYNEDGIDLIAQDWDNLIILDACRYDTFESRSDLPGTLEKRISRGAATPEWLYGNFNDRELKDTVYVTANPMFHEHEAELGTVFHDVWHLWKEGMGWDYDLQTVPPETTASYAEKAAEQYPNKRLIVHFNQPHGPLIGPTAEGSVLGPAKPMRDRSFLYDLWHRLRFSMLTTDTFQQAYAETFDITHDAVEQLLPSLDGKTVISADHGEMLGERPWPLPLRHFSHYRGFYRPELVEVPWHVIEGDERKEIITEEPKEDAAKPTVDDEVVSERLRDMGYIA